MLGAASISPYWGLAVQKVHLRSPRCAGTYPRFKRGEPRSPPPPLREDVQQGDERRAVDDLAAGDQGMDVGERHPLDALRLGEVGRRSDVPGPAGAEEM